MKIGEFITEAMTDIVYHMRDLTYAYEIIKNNRVRLSRVGRKEMNAVEQARHFFFLSTARSRHSGFFRRGSGRASQAVVFVLDGRKLSHNYRAIPVDYFSQQSMDMDEMEDRLVTDKPIIDNFISRYTLYIDILDLGTRREEHLVKLIEQKGYISKVRVFRSDSDFLHGRLNWISGQEFLEERSVEEPDESRFQQEPREIEKHQDVILDLISIYMTRVQRNMQNLTQSARHTLVTIQMKGGDSFAYELVNAFEELPTNNRYSNALIQIFRNERVRPNIREITEFLERLVDDI